MNETKKGYKTTEFWLTMAAVVLSAAVASGVIPAEGPWAQIVSTALAALAALGYTGFRAKAKADAFKASVLSGAPKNP